MDLFQEYAMNGLIGIALLLFAVVGIVALCLFIMGIIWVIKDEQKRIMTEIKNFRDKDIDIIPYKEDEKMQDLDKGAKGSPKDGAQTPVTKQEGFSDDRKQEKNIKGGD